MKCAVVVEGFWHIIYQCFAVTVLLGEESSLMAPKTGFCVFSEFCQLKRSCG